MQAWVEGWQCWYAMEALGEKFQRSIKLHFNTFCRLFQNESLRWSLKAWGKYFNKWGINLHFEHFWRLFQIHFLVKKCYSTKYIFRYCVQLEKFLSKKGEFSNTFYKRKWYHLLNVKHPSLFKHTGTF